MNRRGQALIEFVLILPIFLIILFAIVDFGNLILSRNQLENTSSDIVRIILKGDRIEDGQDEYKDIRIEFNGYKDKYRKVTVFKNIKIITPFLDKVLGNPCVVKVERIIPNDE